MDSRFLIITSFFKIKRALVYRYRVQALKALDIEHCQLDSSRTTFSTKKLLKKFNQEQSNHITLPDYTDNK